MESNYSLADIRAATEDRNEEGWGGGWFWIVVLFLFMFGFGGNGMWGNRNDGALTRADLCQNTNFSQLENAVRGVQNGLCDGFYAVNTGMLNGFNGVQRDMCAGFSAVNSGIAENRFAAQQCCCETNRNIDASRFAAQQNTCEITKAIHCEGEQTRALINSNTMQTLRDKLAEKDRDIQSRDFQLSQIAQTANIVNQVRPCPTPAYITCNPWGNTYGYGAGYPFGFYGNNNNCGCCSYA